MKKYLFGKYYLGKGKKPRLIWIGPLTQEEMEQDFDEFRHNKKEVKICQPISKHY